MEKCLVSNTCHIKRNYRTSEGLTLFKCTGANLFQCKWKYIGPENSAPLKCRIPDFQQINRILNRLQCHTAFKSTFTDNRNAVRQFYCLDCHTTFECFITDGFNGIRNRHIRQFTTSEEFTLTGKCSALGNYHFFQTGTFPECIISDNGSRIGKL